MPRVSDIMQADVITVSPDATVSQLIEKLDSAGISGVAVVDGSENLLGVASSRDVIRLARDMEKVPEAMRWGLAVTGAPRETPVVDAPPGGEFYAYYVTPGGGFVDVRDQIRDLPGSLFDGYRVEDIMTPAPHTISPNATLQELARLLRDAGVHRALVVEEDRLVGIVTTMDILVALAED